MSAELVDPSDDVLLPGPPLGGTVCDAKIRPLPNDTEIVCDRTDSHEEHRGVLHDYAYPGSATVITWQDSDRRTFRGDWAPCLKNCTLPANHKGSCAP